MSSDNQLRPAPEDDPTPKIREKGISMYTFESTSCVEVASHINFTLNIRSLPAILRSTIPRLAKLLCSLNDYTYPDRMDPQPK